MDALQLLTPIKKRGLQFKNRVFMAPMTRSRAADQIANDLMATYYGQRASAGLIITEASQISPQGVGYIATPGIHSQAQIDGWKKVTQEIHRQDGKVFIQLWHVGRVSHPDFHNGQLPVAPSAIPFKGQSFTPQGLKDTVTPRAMTLAEIQSTIQDYKKAAEAAKQAGFDGIEIHAANGYLPHQFLEDGSNHRTDNYGGSIENRVRFLLEIIDAVIPIWGSEHISVRISPQNPFNGMSDSDPESTYTHLVQQLEQRNIGMLHMVDTANLNKGINSLAPIMRQLFSGILLLNAGYDKQSAEDAIKSGIADAISFGKLFISNPDLPERFAHDASLTVADTNYFYGGNEKGYSDYSTLS
jgi:N-ethylmaleimide reductase